MSGGDPEVDSGSGSPADPKRAWLEVLFGHRLVTVKPDTQKTGAGSVPKGALPATDTDMFFEYKLAALTDSDRKSLDAYAKAYLDAQSSEKIVVDGYASVEGDKKDNQKLSEDRAKAVKDYLIQQGVPGDKISTKGQGATGGSSPGDLQKNRRATLKPKPPAAPSTPAPTPPPGKGRMPPMRKPNLKPKLPDDDTVPRSQFEPALKDFFEELLKAQGGPKVKVTAKVQTAGKTLAEGLPEAQNVDSKLLNNKKEYEPGDLAKEIANLLPPRIPGKNFRRFLEKIRPTDFLSKKPKTFTGQLSAKMKEEIHDFAKDLPVSKTWQDRAEKVLTTGISKLSSKGIKEGLKGLDIPDTAKESIQKFGDDYIEKLEKGEKQEDPK